MRTAMGEETESPETSAAGESSLRRTIESISALISLSYSIKMFTAKWTMIRTKLEELNSGLVAVQNCEANENPALSGILSNTWRTIDDCHGVARRCADLSYSGKLLMQSDLDVLYSRLDLHCRKLSVVYDSGVLNHRFAIVVSRPGAGACRDDMRFYVGDLMTRMKIGDAQMKRQALANLYEAVAEDDKYVKVVAEQSEIVGALIGFLDSNEVEIQQLSAKVVSVISGFDSYKGVLVGGGVLAPLVRVVEGGSLIGKEGAAKSLQRLTENSDNGWSISAHGGVTALLKLCSGGDVKAELVGPACGALKNLIGVEEIKRFVVEEGAIAMFVGLIRSKDEALQINSIEFLNNVASGDEGVRVLVIREGGVRALVRVLEYRSGCSCKVRETALRAIESLCFCSPNSVGLLIRYGFVDQLMSFVRNGDEVSMQELALKVAIRMCGRTEEAKKALGDANFMTELVKFLDSKSFEVREMAAEALSNMVSNPKNRKRFVQDDRNMGLLLQRFDPEQGNAGNKRLLLSILMSLTSSSSGRRKISNSGYLKNIEKLAEAEVSDAKKLVKKLSTNRFRSMLSGIWHS